MPVIKNFNLYEISGGTKVPILSIEPKEKKELTQKEINEAAAEVLEIFYQYDKVKLFNESGNGFVSRGIENKTFVIETVLE